MSEEIQAESEQNSSNGSGCLAFIIGGGIIFLIIIAIITAFQIYTDEVWLVPGDPDNFDPVAEYLMVLDYAGDNAQLTRIEALFVKSDGTLDLNAGYDPAPTVSYYFYRPTRDNNAPTGTASQDAIWYSQVVITISQPYEWSFATQGAGEDAGFSMVLNLGMDRDRYTEVLAPPPQSLEFPRCSFADFWQTALENGADNDAVATIIYDERGYQFLIQGTSLNLMFNNDCELQN